MLALINDLLRDKGLMLRAGTVVAGNVNYGVEVNALLHGDEKNTAQLMTLFALSNLWMVRGKLLGAKA